MFEFVSVCVCMWKSKKRTEKNELKKIKQENRCAVIVYISSVCDSLSQYNDDESESNERVSIKNLEEQPKTNHFFSSIFFRPNNFRRKYKRTIEFLQKQY